MGKQLTAEILKKETKIDEVVAPKTRVTDVKVPKEDEKKPIPIACPSIDAATIEGLIDLLVVKGLLTEDELYQAAELYGSYVNGLLDLLSIKKIVEDWELDIAITEYHHCVRAMGTNTNIPPAVLFSKRRNIIKERLEFEHKMRSKNPSS